MKRVRKALSFSIPAIFCKIGCPSAAACAACFGQSDSSMAQGMNMGIFALLLVITSVLCGVASFFVYVAKRSAQLEEAGRPFHPEFPQDHTNA